LVRKTIIIELTLENAELVQGTKFSEKFSNINQLLQERILVTVTNLAEEILPNLPKTTT
jgi:hypothetical protein